MLLSLASACMAQKDHLRNLDSANMLTVSCADQVQAAEVCSPVVCLQTCAQVLLTLNNLSDRGPYLNARNTFQELLEYGTIPTVNENDTIAVEEIRFGDNDTLSAQVHASCGLLTWDANFVMGTPR